MINSMNTRAIIAGVAIAALFAPALASVKGTPHHAHVFHHARGWDPDCDRNKTKPTPASAPVVVSPPPAPAAPAPAPIAAPVVQTPAIPTPQPPKAPVVFPPAHDGPCSRAGLDPVEKLACKWWGDL